MKNDVFNGVVNILNTNKDSIGTGFFVTSDGYILTCYHVYKETNSTNQQVYFKYDSIETTHIATLKSFDEKKDIALLHTDISPKKYYTIEESGYKGEVLKTLGFPEKEKTGMIADPILQGFIENGNIIQLDRANTITSGFSGAPLINNESFVIGMIRAIPNPEISRGRMENVAVAISAKEINSIFSDYLNVSEKQGQISDSLLGRDRELKYLEFLKEASESYLNNIGVVNLSGSVIKLQSIGEMPKGNFFKGIRVPINPKYQLEINNERGKIVDNIWSCIETETQKVILLGEPGSGKTVSSLKLTLDYAELALNDENELIPVFVPLGSFKEDIPIEEYMISERLYGLVNYDGYTFDKNRFIFIFDAFNELESSKKTSVVEYIKKLNRFIVSCRSLDYKTDFSATKNLTKVNILDFDLEQIERYINNTFFNQITAQNLWESLGGCPDLYNFWKKVNQEKEGELFWHSPKFIDSSIIEKLSTTPAENTAWQKMHDKGLLPLCRSPLLLSIVCKIFKDGNELPQNNGTLFEQFVNSCLNEELKRKIEIGELEANKADELKIMANNTMSYLAEAIITGKQGTGISTAKGRECLKLHFNDEQISSCEKLSQGAKLLLVDDKEIRFFHQLLQEYFASKFLKTAFEKNLSAKEFFNQQTWWAPNGWEESAVILVGILCPDGKNLTEVNKYLLWLSEAHPNLVVRCIEKAGISVLNMQTLDNNTHYELQKKLISRLENSEDSFQSKVEIGRALGKLGDSRNGVGIEAYEGKKLPKIRWIEHLQQKNFQMSKYPITVEQFLAFVNAFDGYNVPESWSFSKEARNWYDNYQNGKRKKKWLAEFWELHSNEPIVNVSWIEAEAFCLWLSKSSNMLIRLPTEIEWRSFQSNTLYNFSLNELAPVGLIDEKNNNILVSDFGLVWEWCRDIYGGDKATPISTRILKGGSWRYGTEYQSKSYQFRTYPFFERDDIGFRILREK